MGPLRPRPFRNPGLAVLAVLAMGIGIGAFGGSVSMARAILRDLPVERPERVVELARTLDRWPGRYVSVRGAHLDAIRTGVAGLEAVGGFRRLDVHVTGDDGPPIRVDAAAMSSGVFRALRVDPLLGRWLRPEDEQPGAEPVVVLGHVLWQSRYGGGRDVLGRRIGVDGQPATIVGVMPPGFTFPREEQLWLPAGLSPDPEEEGEGVGPLVTGIGRLRDGATLERVRAEVAGVTRALREDGLAGDVLGTLTVRRWTERIRSGETARAVPALVVLFFLVLLVACANVALLFLVRALRAERPTAMRLALGAPRRTLILERLLETLALAGLGGLLGLAVSLGWTRLLRRLFEGDMEYGLQIGVDWVVVVATMAAVVLAALVAGLVPALRGTDLDLAASLREGTAGGGSLRLGKAARVLLVAEVAFSCAVLVGIGFMVRGVRAALLDEPTMAAERILVARYELLPRRHPDPHARTELHRRIVEALEAHPGVERAALAAALPGAVPALGAPEWDVEIEGTRHVGEGNRVPTRLMIASPEYFSLAGIEVLRGRGLTWSQGADQERVAVVNESFARSYLGGEDPVGMRVSWGPDRWWTVVGVVSDVGTRRADGRADAVYIPFSWGEPRAWVMALARGDPLGLVPVVRDAIWEEDEQIPISDAGTLAETYRERTRPPRVMVTLFATFGLAALLITLVGLHGVMSFYVGRRTREIAVRSALGARASSLGWLVLRTVGGQVVAGVLVGVALAWWLAPHLGEALFGSDPRDPFLYVVIPGVVMLSAVVAGLGPMLRAVRLEIMEALRVE